MPSTGHSLSAVHLGLFEAVWFFGDNRPRQVRDCPVASSWCIALSIIDMASSICLPRDFTFLPVPTVGDSRIHGQNRGTGGTEDPSNSTHVLAVRTWPRLEHLSWIWYTLSTACYTRKRCQRLYFALPLLCRVDGDVSLSFDGRSKVAQKHT
jgi:hypothetical protein